MITFRHGAFSNKGTKPINQDHHCVVVPDFSPSANFDAIAVVSDGISSSQVSQYASNFAVETFAREFSRTSSVWSLSRAAQHVLRTINTELYIKNQQSPYFENLDKGYVCTFSAVILKGQSAVLLHCGDSSIYHVHRGEVTLCTRQHREAGESNNTYLSNALGIRPNLSIDMAIRTLAPSDIFVLMTDGIADTLSPKTWYSIHQHNTPSIDLSAQHIAQAALNADCDDNVTVVLLEVLSIAKEEKVHYASNGFLPFLDTPKSNDAIDDWTIQRQLYTSERSLVFLAKHNLHNHQAVLKIPAKSMHDNESFLDEMVKEEWIGARVQHDNVLKNYTSPFLRHYFYIAMAYTPGISLRQYRDDVGSVSLSEVRDWSAQIVSALTALHRQDVLHQDIKPDNIMVDENGKITLVDFGAASIAGYHVSQSDVQHAVPGDLLFTAPEYFVGLWPDESADQFSLAVVLYFLLSGEYPFNSNVAKKSNYAGLLKLRYISLLQRNVAVPMWVDEALKRACHPKASKRYPSLSEFLYDLNHPNPSYRKSLPLMEQHPVRAWQTVSGVLLVLLIVMFVVHYT
ncbi:protein kinase [Alteromonas genovensis]|uniref:Protein kinase n=1 Tax=Alteromonas genovensis TaxID=471225 RepID=A0A6N9TEM6_9ALTE|nr:protein kinase [Alteromonas genovensis]